MAYARDHERATLELMKLLRQLVATSGQLGPIGELQSGGPITDARDIHLASRLAAALGTLFSDPEFHLSEIGFERLIRVQQWLSIIFGASTFGNADHLIQSFNRAGEGGHSQVTLAERDLAKFCLLYSLDSSISLEPERLWAKNKKLAASLFLAILSSRLVLTEAAHAKREALLGWLTPRLAELSLDDLPAEILHQAWMHCSYAYREDKHAIKRGINELIRRKLLSIGIADIGHQPRRREKPLLLCILEQFVSNHSVYRVHSLSIEALREKYHVVGVGQADSCDSESRQVFDEVRAIPTAQTLLDFVRQVHAVAEELSPDLVYYPSVGMSAHAVFLANVRLAPLQFVGLGHPATTCALCIDYAIVEDDYLGDPRRFSERLMAVPALAIPYRPRTDATIVHPRSGAPDGHRVRVAVAATVMKINAPFLATLARIAEMSEVPLEFQFFSGAARGLVKTYVQNVIHRFLPGSAVVHPQVSYESYLRNLNSCDMFLSPFPFGGTNSIVDAARQGLPGVCLTGAEVHQHMDEGLFGRLGLPRWLVARNIDEYVNAAVRLAADVTERQRLRQHLAQNDVDAILFSGKPAVFACAVQWLQENHSGVKATDGSAVLHPPSAAISIAQT